MADIIFGWDDALLVENEDPDTVEATQALCDELSFQPEFALEVVKLVKSKILHW